MVAILYFRLSHLLAAAKVTTPAVPVAQAVALQTSVHQAAPELRVKATMGAGMVPVLVTLAAAAVVLVLRAAMAPVLALFHMPATAVKVCNPL
jgi:hypothetical protein